MKTATAVGLVIGLTFLAGCAVSVDGPTAPAAPAPASAPVSEPASAPTETAPAAPSASAPTASGTAMSDHDKRRNQSFDTVTGCPDGVLVLDMDMQDVLVTEDCKKITVSAFQVTLFAEHVDSLVILKGADQVTATVRSADSVVMDGDQGNVYWEEGRPAKVQVRGVQNTAVPISE